MGYKVDERLLVLTNHRLYLLKKPNLFWKPCEQCSPDKFCPEGPSLDTGSGLARNGSVRYDCIHRLIYGSSGQWLHIGIDQERAATTMEIDSTDGFNALNYTARTIGSSNDLQTKLTSQSGLHVYCPRHLSARNICATIKDITSNWKDHATTTLGYPHTYEYEPPNHRYMEVDVPMKYALARVLMECKGSSGSSGSNGGNGGNGGNGRNGRNGRNGNTSKGGRGQDQDGSLLNGDDDDGSVATMSLREVDKKAKEALLVTFVKQFTIEGDAVTGSTEFEDKVLILTKKHFIVCDYDPSKWNFPVDWGEIQMMAKSEFDKEKKEIDGRINKAKRDEDRSTLSLKRGDNRNRLIRMQKEQRYEMF
jgi:uncharacterized membrane protein YgcG